MKYRIGIDLGGTNIVMGIISENRDIISKLSVPTLKDKSPDAIVADMADGIFKLLKETRLNASDFISIGIGVPGTADFDSGIVVYAPNINWRNVRLAETLESKTGIPVKLNNDANCAAYGEALAGAAKGAKNVVLLTLGTGLGAGIIIDGKIYSGCFSSGGEFGHTLLVLDGRECGCGRRGCLEAYASATGLIRETADILRNYPESALNGMCGDKLDEINGKMIFKAANDGDECAKTAVKSYIKYLGEGIINAVNIFRPEKIVLGGGIAEAGKSLINPVNEYIKDKCYGGSLIPVSPVVQAVLGNDAGIIGAGML